MSRLISVDTNIDFENERFISHTVKKFCSEESVEILLTLVKNIIKKTNGRIMIVGDDWENVDEIKNKIKQRLDIEIYSLPDESRGRRICVVPKFLAKIFYEQQYAKEYYFDNLIMFYPCNRDQTFMWTGYLNLDYLKTVYDFNFTNEHCVQRKSERYGVYKQRGIDI